MTTEYVSQAGVTIIAQDETPEILVSQAGVTAVAQDQTPEILVSQAGVTVVVLGSAINAYGSAFADEDGLDRVVPAPGDRAAWDDDNYPKRHAAGIVSGSGKHHLPNTGDEGDLLVKRENGSEWQSQAKRITELDEPTTVSQFDVIEIVDVSEDETLKITVADLLGAELVADSVELDFSTSIPSSWEPVFGTVSASSGKLHADTFGPAAYFKGYAIHLEGDNSYPATGSESWDECPWFYFYSFYTTNSVAFEEVVDSGRPEGQQDVLKIHTTTSNSEKKFLGMYGGYTPYSTRLYGSVYIRKEDASDPDVQLAILNTDNSIAHSFGSVTGTSWTKVSGSCDPASGSSYAYLAVVWPEDAPADCYVRIDDLSLRYAAAGIVYDWGSKDVCIEVDAVVPTTGMGAFGIIARYEDESNYLMFVVSCNPTDQSSVLVEPVAVIDDVERGLGAMVIKSLDKPSVTGGQTYNFTLHLYEDSFRLDYKLSTDSDYTTIRSGGTLGLRGTKHGALDMCGDSDMVSRVKLLSQDEFATSRGALITIPFVYAGTMTAGMYVEWTAPFDCQIIHVSAVQQNAGDARFKLGDDTDDDWALLYTTLGQSGEPVVLDKFYDFRHDAFPTLRSGDSIRMRIDHDGIGGISGQDVTIILTLRVI